MTPLAIDPQAILTSLFALISAVGVAYITIKGKKSDNAVSERLGSNTNQQASYDQAQEDLTDLRAENRKLREDVDTVTTNAKVREAKAQEQIDALWARVEADRIKHDAEMRALRVEFETQRVNYEAEINALHLHITQGLGPPPPSRRKPSA